MNLIFWVLLVLVVVSALTAGWEIRRSRRLARDVDELIGDRSALLRVAARCWLQSETRDNAHAVHAILDEECRGRPYLHDLFHVAAKDVAPRTDEDEALLQ